MVAYLGYTLRMRTLFRGWPIMVNDTHTRRRRRTSPGPAWYQSGPGLVPVRANGYHAGRCGLGNANPEVIFQTRVYGFDRIQTRVTGFDNMVGHLSVADSQIVYYKQLHGGQLEVWLARYLEDLKRSVPVLQKRQLKQHHMSTTSTS